MAMGTEKISRFFASASLNCCFFVGGVGFCGLGFADFYFFWRSLTKTQALRLYGGRSAWQGVMVFLFLYNGWLSHWMRWSFFMFHFIFFHTPPSV